MGSRKPFVGRDCEYERAMEAIRAGRSVVIEGSAGAGKSHLVAQVMDACDDERPLVRVVSSRGRISLLAAGESVALTPAPEGGTRESLESVWAAGALLVVDDLDALPCELVEVIVDLVVCRGLQVVATVRPSSVRADTGEDVSCAVDRLMDAGDVARIPLAAFSLEATRQLGEAQRRYLGEQTPAEDWWIAALHRLSGGIPALIVEIVAHAFDYDRMSSIEPLELRSAPISGVLVDTAQRSLAGLTGGQLRFLVVLGELGPVPSSHLDFLSRPETTGRLSDARLLAASTDAGRIATGELVSWIARRTVDVAKLERQAASISRRMLTMASRGVALTSAEEIFCARHSSAIVVDELTGIERQALHGMLTRAALSIARSRTPRDAIAIAERALGMAPSPTAAVAVVLAAAAAGDDALADEWIATLGLPRDRAEAELFLIAHMARFYGPDLDASPPLDVALMRSWLPDDPSWRAVIDGIDVVLTCMVGQDLVIGDELAWWSEDDADPAISEVDAARRSALEALVHALRGRGERAVALLQRRRRAHGLDTEPRFEIFALHAYVLVILGLDDERLRTSLRRRMAAARIGDRQDQLQTLALLDAALHLGHRDARGMFTSLQVVETEPREFLAIWLDVLRACAHVLERDLGRAAELLQRIDRVPDTWVGGSFAAVRDVAQTLFELATGQPSIAGRRALVAAHRSSVTAPATSLTLLTLAHAAGVPTEHVLERALELAATADLPRLEPYIRELRGEVGRAGMESWDVLTVREREVATMAMRGMPSAEIAKRLQLSVRTVESHLHHARTRLGMRRTQRFTDISAGEERTTPFALGPTRADVG